MDRTFESHPIDQAGADHEMCIRDRNPYEENSKTHELEETGKVASTGFYANTVNQKFTFDATDKLSFYARGGYYDNKTRRPYEADVYKRQVSPKPFPMNKVPARGTYGYFPSAETNVDVIRYGLHDYIRLN